METILRNKEVSTSHLTQVDQAYKAKDNHPNNPKLITQVTRTLTVSKTNHIEHLQNHVQTLINIKQQPLIKAKRSISMT
jgi:hypothetical protein